VRIFIVIAVVALLVGLALARKIINGLLGELGGEPKQVVEVMKRMAEGDLSTEIQVNEKYPGSVLDSTKQMQGKMHAMISGVISSANQLSSSAGQLSTASTQLAVGIEAQGSATASMAASVEQLAVSVAHVSDSSSEGDKLASRSSALSRDGSDVIQRTTNSILSTVEKVQETSEEIARLEKESVSISAVVKVIKEVAEQTNLLALNAAIEAARAGEQGRGFAVVADEVRKLAERTSSATIEIGALIDRIQSSSRAAVKCMSGVVVDVGMGADMAKHAGVSIGEIAGMSDSVRQVSKEISNALSEQNVACTDIAQNVERVAQMSEENAAATQQVATSAQSLADISQGLASSVAYFRV
jgi:methyl-accepting chemotaxis protein